MLSLSAQDVLVVTETIFLGDTAGRQEPFLSLRLPLPIDSQQVTDITYSTPPSGREVSPIIHIYAWNAAALRGLDSLTITYRLLPRVSPRWDFERKGSEEIAGVATMTSPEYPLPTLVKADFERTGYGNLRERNLTKAVNKILTTLEKRIKVTSELADFNNEQPLLQDLHRRLTTERRFPQLVSLMLQYYGIEHRLVSGKLLAERQIYENQLWVEIKIAGQWQRLPANSDRDYLEYAADFQYLTCSYDYLDYSFELFGLPKAEWRHTYQPLVVKLWDQKEEALDSQNYDLAIQLIDSVIDLSRRSVIAISEKGLILTESGLPMEGMKYLQLTLNRATEINDRAMVLLQMAKYYSLQDQLEESVSALERSNLVAPLDFSVVLTDRRFKNLRDDKNILNRILRNHPEAYYQGDNYLGGQ